MKSGEIQQYYLRDLIGELTGWNDPREKLTKAFARDEFVLFGQPILKLAPGGDERAQVEIFVRLKEEERNLVPPGTFLPILEYHKLGPKLDRHVLRKTLVWYISGPRNARAVIHVNLCHGTLFDPEFPSFVISEIKATGCRCENLCFEIPGMETPYGETTLQLVKDLKAARCRIAVRVLDKDHISFQPMKDFDADFVKIGGSFIRGSQDDKGAMTKLRALARACRAFGIQTIAQDVEDRQVLEVLRSVGIDHAQGYGISKPALLENLAKPKRSAG